MIQSDVDGSGGIIILSDPKRSKGDAFIKRTLDNSVKCGRIMAEALKIMRDDIIALQDAPLVKKNGRK